MNVRVRLFAAAKELAGIDELVVDVPDGSTVGALQDAVVAAAPGLARIVTHSLWAVGAEYVSKSVVLTSDADVAMIPPVSGG